MHEAFSTQPSKPDTIQSGLFTFICWVNIQNRLCCANTFLVNSDLKAKCLSLSKVSPQRRGGKGMGGSMARGLHGKKIPSLHPVRHSVRKLVVSQHTCAGRAGRILILRAPPITHAGCLVQAKPLATSS